MTPTPACCSARPGPALWAAGEIRRLITREILSLSDRPKFHTHTVEGYRAMNSHVQVRFGLWQDIIDEPMAGDPGLHVMTTALQHYAKGVAHATARNFADAEVERERFQRHLETIAPERRFLTQSGAGLARSGRGTPRR